MYWPQQLVASALVAIAILLLSLLPARHVLLPLWPSRINEFVALQDGQGTATRTFQKALSEADSFGVLAMSQPLSVAAVDYRDGRIALGYPVGIRSEESNSAPWDGALPLELRVTLNRSLPQDDRSLLLMDANDQLRSIPLRDIETLYYPNRLNFVDRAGLVVHRVRAALIGQAPSRPAMPVQRAVTELE